MPLQKLLAPLFKVALIAFLFVPLACAAPAGGSAPTVTSGPVATVLSPTSVQVTWTTNVPADSFVYYEPEGDGYDSGLLDAAGVTNHVVTISGLRPGLSYQFGVRSRAVVGGRPVVTSPVFSMYVSVKLPQAATNGEFDYYFVPEGPHHVVQGYDLFVLLNAGFFSGTANFKHDSYKVTVQNLPPHSTVHWPDQEYNGSGQGRRTSTYTANDSIAFWAPGTTEFQLQTNQGGTTPPGTYSLNLTVSTLLADGRPGPSKSVPWTVVVEAVPAPLSGPPASYPPIPSLGEWRSNMTTYGAGNWCNVLTRTGGPCGAAYEQCSWYYDGERVFYQIADYTKNTKWDICALNVQAHYRDQYVLAQTPPGAVPGWRVFPDGLYMNYLRTGDPLSKAAVHDLATHAAGSSLRSWHIPASLIREATYMLTAKRLDTKLGNDSSRQMQQMVSVVLGQIDQITSGGAEWNQPFMDGLAAEALIHYYEDGHQDDVRVPAAIQKLADWLWANAWIPNKGAGYFYYNSYQASIGMAEDESLRNLNLLIAPMYAWLFKMTGNAKYQVEGDQIFASGVQYEPGGTLGWSGKNFMQQYRWSFDFVKWRLPSLLPSSPVSDARLPKEGTNCNESSTRRVAKDC